ncbi:MAG: hypothetical protein AB7S75_11705 [Desulfococcaceae bacterium]
MPVYDCSDVCNNLSRLLNEAKENKEVIIKSNTGDLFIVRIIPKKKSEYNLPKLDLGLSREEIVSYIRETRERQ